MEESMALPTTNRRTHLALSSLLADMSLSSGAISDFLSAETFPLLEPGRCTFVWQGEAERVELLRWIRAGVDRRAFERVPGSDLWLLPLAVEDDGRFEYKLAIGKDGGEDWIVDPLNPERATDPFGENSVCRTFGYRRPAWSLPGDAPAGRIETVTVASESFGETREERLYLPAGYDDSVPHPLLIVHDGDDFVAHGDLATSLDNLIEAGDIPPLIAALVQTRDRMDEYPRGRRHARYVVQELLPLLEDQLQKPIRGKIQRLGIMQGRTHRHRRLQVRTAIIPVANAGARNVASFFSHSPLGICMSS